MIGAILAGVQGAIGLGQTIAGALKKKPIIPEADISQEMFDSMSDAEYWSFIGMPPEQRQRAIEDISRTGIQAQDQASTRKAGLGMTSMIAQNQTEGYKNLADLDTKMRYQNVLRLDERRDRMTAERNRVDDINRNIKLDERDRRDELIGAGMQNVMGALGTAASLFGDDEGDGLGDPAKKAERKAARAGRRDARAQKNAMGSAVGAASYGNYETFA